MKEEKTPSQSLYFIDDALNDDSDVKKQSVQKSEKSKDTTDFDYKTFLKTIPNRTG